MQASRIDAEEALRTGFIEQVVENNAAKDEAVQRLITEVMTTGPCAVTLAKELTLGFDRWTGTDEELREYTLDFTSKMRGSKEGQEGLSSFLDKRDANWKS
jgi:methylglutaconyl-CoA hydratase